EPRRIDIAHGSDGHVFAKEAVQIAFSLAAHADMPQHDPLIRPPRRTGNEQRSRNRPHCDGRGMKKATAGEIGIGHVIPATNRRSECEVCNRTCVVQLIEWSRTAPAWSHPRETGKVQTGITATVWRLPPAPVPAARAY